MTRDECLDRVRAHCKQRLYRTLVYNPPSLDYARALRWRVPGAFDVMPKEWTPAWDEPVRQMPGQLLDRWPYKRGYNLMVLYEGEPGLLLRSHVRNTRYDRTAVIYLVVNWDRGNECVSAASQAEYHVRDHWSGPSFLHYILEAQW